jgi:hypothetical protein
MTLELFMVIVQLQMFVFAAGALLSLSKYNTKHLYLKVLGVILVTSTAINFSIYIASAHGNENINFLSYIHQSAPLLKKIEKLLLSIFAAGTLVLLLIYRPSEIYIKFLGLGLLASVIGDFSAGFLHDLKINVNYSASIYRIIAFPLISTLYFYALGKQHRKSFFYINIAYFIFAVLNVLFIQKSTINTYALVLNSILVIIFCLYYFYWLLKELPTAQLQRLPMFWINSAFIIYFSGNLFLFVFTSYLVHVLNSNLLVYWTIHNILGIIEGLMIVIALWLDLRNIKSPS